MDNNGVKKGNTSDQEDSSMDVAFGWIGEFIHWIISWLPKRRICRATHGGIKFVRGKDVKEINPGIFWYWPVNTEVTLIKTARDSSDVPSQNVPTKDDYPVNVSVVIVHEITDVKRALAKTADVKNTILEIAAPATLGVVGKYKYDDLRKGLSTSVKDDLTKLCKKLLRPFGVKVVEAYFTDFSWTQYVIRNIGDGGGAVPVIPEIDKSE